MSPIEKGLLLGVLIGTVWMVCDAIAGRGRNSEEDISRKIGVNPDGSPFREGDADWMGHLNARFDRVESLVCRNHGAGSSGGGIAYGGASYVAGGGGAGAAGGGAGGVARIGIPKQKIVVLLDRGEQTDAIAAARDADMVIVVSTMVPTGRVTKYRYGPESDIDLVVIR